MKSMTWKPDPAHDEQVNAYLESINHAPYFTISAITFGLFCLFTLIVLVGVF
ncbi:hypothetical protein [Phormidium tenue]|uniref:hypothetical protein n=1 Tax=Phormidium tenue TaxID=126344 RepID=UPI0015C52D20|nr:hypothetical protein [Phormidium tenue]MBD2231776.1 hypothetical protein [Phormidium tenue FACHB-1052]